VHTQKEPLEAADGAYAGTGPAANGEAWNIRLFPRDYNTHPRRMFVNVQAGTGKRESSSGKEAQ